jgi:hypothetical protein
MYKQITKHAQNQKHFQDKKKSMHEIKYQVKKYESNKNT